MPLLIFGAVIALCVAVYMYFLNHQDRFTRTTPKPQSPFDVIYLPADLEAAKRKSQASQGERNHSEANYSEHNQDENNRDESGHQDEIRHQKEDSDR